MNPKFPGATLTYRPAEVGKELDETLGHRCRGEGGDRT